MAWGYVIDAQEAGLFTGGDARAADPSNTNNIAEYYALGFALHRVTDLLNGMMRSKFAGLKIRGDSKLVCEQVNGSWSVKSPHLQPLHKRCLDLLGATGQPWAIEWIPREQNGLADELSRDAYKRLTGKAPPQRHGSAA